jgi:hypothetical protein
MKSKLSSLLRKVFLGSLAGLAASNTNAANNTIIEPISNEDESKNVSLFKKKIDLTPKLLLKRNSNDELLAMAHRSHRSHSSHRSHYSSSSGGSYTPPSNSGNSGLSPGSKSNSGSSNNGTTTVLKLGSRTLKKGMSGTDVTELVNILLRKEYLKLDGGGTQVTGSYDFDETIEGAVKKFQSDNGLTSDGICGSTTIYYLKNK